MYKRPFKRPNGPRHLNAPAVNRTLDMYANKRYLEARTVHNTGKMLQEYFKSLSSQKQSPCGAWAFTNYQYTGV